VGRLIGLAAAGAVTVLVVLVAVTAGVVSAVTGGLGTSGGAYTVTAGCAGTPAGLSAAQTAYATVIVTVGVSLRVPTRGWVIAVATALRESDLANPATASDHDSLGLFQQRPSEGWGTAAQLTDPTYAATAFYRELLTVPGWQSMALTDAAQAVQRSATPSAFAAHETRAAAIVTALTACLTSPAAGIGGWVHPVPGTLVSGFRTRDRPGHDGVDLAASRGTLVGAVTAGTVVTVLCNIAGHSYQPGDPGAAACDRDGYAGLGGCGWYVEIRHTLTAGTVVSRYCHMLRRPAVIVGQPVTAGQALGVVGTSGDSSGPHLHLEIHTAYPAAEGNATDPVPFLATHGVRL
jgi:murein DD-endopeptidase MepM/ murein hydrolase activator NlpD